MKKFILLIIASIVCGYVSYAQQEQQIEVDGLTLGASKMTVISQIGSLKEKVKLASRNDENRWLEYQTMAGDSYTIYYDAFDIVYRIVKILKSGVPGAAEEDYNSEYVDILYKYGEPIVKGNSSMIWRGNNYKIKLSYISTVRQAQNPYDRTFTNYSIISDYEIVE